MPAHITIDDYMDFNTNYDGRKRKRRTPASNITSGTIKKASKTSKQNIIQDIKIKHNEKRTYNKSKNTIT